MSELTNKRAEESLTEGRVELVQAEMPVVVVVVVAQQVLHGALQQAVLQVLLHGDLQTEGRTLNHTDKFWEHFRIFFPCPFFRSPQKSCTFLLLLPSSLKAAIQAQEASGLFN